MNRPADLLFLLSALLTASVVSVEAGAASGERIALQGLVPPVHDVEVDMRKGIVPQQPGLRLPRRASGPQILDFANPAGDGFSAYLYSGTRNAQRLSVEPSQSFGGIRYPFSRNWASSIEATVDTPSSNGRGYALSGQMHRYFPGGWDLSFGLQYNVHDPSAPRLPAMLSDTGSLFAGPLSTLAAGTSGSTGYELRLNFRYGERNVIGLTYGSGRDFDVTRQMLGVLPADGRQFGLTGHHWLTPDWALSYGLMAQEQVGPVRGQGLRLGLRYSF